MNLLYLVLNYGLFIISKTSINKISTLIYRFLVEEYLSLVIFSLKILPEIEKKNDG